VYSVIVTDSVGCQKTVYLQINQPPQITFNASVLNIGCTGAGTGSIFTNAGGGVGPYSYLWSTGATTDSLTGLAAGTYTLTVTDASGCTNTGSFNIITVPPFVIDSTASTQATCGASNGTATIFVSGTPPYTYVWNPPVSVTNTATGLIAGTYNVQVTDSNGCIVNTSITVNATGTFTLTPQSTGLDCSGTGGTASVTVNGTTGPYNYLWSTGATTDTINGLNAGTYTVTVTDINGCSITTNATIQPYIPISLTTSVTIASCNQNNGSATVTATGGSGQYTYSWSPGGATTQSITGVAPGTYTVTVTDANSPTCTETTTVTIGQNPSITFTISADTTVCNGQSANITTNTTGGTPGFSYLWSDGSGATSLTVNPTSTTSYTVTVTDITGCTSMATSTVTVIQYPVISITQAATICDGESIQLSASGGTTYSWTPDNGSLSDINTGSPTASPTSTTNYIVTASNWTCSTVDSVEITVLPSPDAGIVVDSSGGNNITFTNNSTGGTTFFWDFGDGSTATTEDATHTYASGGIYNGYMAVSNANGCSDTATFTVTTNSALIIYNVFTPNTDNHNDYWNFEMHGISNIVAEVYNRWGVKIFDKSNFGSGVDGIVPVWDGITNNGDAAPDGTYFYIVKGKSVIQEYDLSGTITLIRKEK
jgi:gliding motility-associated-like protein